MLRLSCVVQNYDWGVRGRGSRIARMVAAERSHTHTHTDGAEGSAAPVTVELRDDLPYAEYWFGTHPSGPSRVLAGGWHMLQSYLHAHPEALGVPEYSPATALPFLLKVLCVSKALSVQAHPDEALAAKLHAARPSAYKDAQHKPEMALALTPFEAMCGFRRPEELVAAAARHPEVADVLTHTHTHALRDAVAAGADADAMRPVLRAAFEAYMTQSPDVIARCASSLEARLRSAEAGADTHTHKHTHTHLDAADQVFLRLCRDFPGDIGVFAPYVLNVLTLAPGQGIFLPANEPHAYLLGECVEVMACSDNVVRAGLTPKERDVATLVNMLTYNTGMPRVYEGDRVDEFTKQYVPPVREFALMHTRMPANAGPYELPSTPSASIIIVMEGTASVDCTGGDASIAASPVHLFEGAVWLLPASVRASVRAGEAGITFYRASVNPTMYK